MSRFRLHRESIDLPTGAFARGWRTWLLHDDTPLLGVTQGPHRACLHPVLSPAGVPLTAESPADHPHHNGIWVAADHVNLDLSATGEHGDVATYNFYVNETFQGRAPGQIRETEIDGTALSGDRYRIRQILDWRGPAEWGAPEGRLVLSEVRTTTVRLDDQAVCIDLVSTLAAHGRAVDLGPTRHALFGIRLATALCAAGRGRLIDGSGATGATAVSGGTADWIDLSGPTGARIDDSRSGGPRAGLAVMPSPKTDWSPWFATDWGTIAVNPAAAAPVHIPADGRVRHAMRVLAHDGLDATALAAAWDAYKVTDPSEDTA